MELPPILFHVSPKCLKVIDPAKSKGARPLSYFVSHEALLWAIAHVCDKYKTKTVYVHSCRPRSMGTIKAWYHGSVYVYTCKVPTYIVARFKHVAL